MANAKGTTKGGGEPYKAKAPEKSGIAKAIEKAVVTGKTVINKINAVANAGKSGKPTHADNPVALAKAITAKKEPAKTPAKTAPKTSPQENKLKARDDLDAKGVKAGAMGQSKAHTKNIVNNTGAHAPKATAQNKPAQTKTKTNASTSSTKAKAPTYKTDANGRPLYNGTKASRDAQAKYDKSHGGGTKSTQPKGGATGGSTKSGSTKTTTTGGKVNNKPYFDSLQKQAEAYMTEQLGGLRNTRDMGLSDLERAWVENQSQAKSDTDDINYQYDDRKGQIDQSAYQQSQMTNQLAYDNGIQNSQQMLGLQMGDNARTNGLVQEAMTERDRSVNKINDRLARLLEQKGIDTGLINQQYNNGVNVARGGARGLIAKGQGDYYLGDIDFQRDQSMMNTERAWQVADALRDRNWQVEDRNYAGNLTRAGINASRASGGGGGGSANANNLGSLASLFSQYSDFKNGGARPQGPLMYGGQKITYPYANGAPPKAQPMPGFGNGMPKNKSVSTQPVKPQNQLLYNAMNKVAGWMK